MAATLSTPSSPGTWMVLKGVRLVPRKGPPLVRIITFVTSVNHRARRAARILQGGFIMKRIGMLTSGGDCQDE